MFFPSRLQMAFANRRDIFVSNYSPFSVLMQVSGRAGLAQLGRIEVLLTGREKVAEWYAERLAAVEGVQTPWIAREVTRMSWFVYVVRLAPELDRTIIVERLAERGIPARPYFSPVHLQPFYRERFGFGEGDFPVTERVARSTLALPFSGRMTEGQVDLVCRALGEVVGE